VRSLPGGKGGSPDNVSSDVLSVPSFILGHMDTIAVLTALAAGLALGCVVGVLWARSRPAYAAGLVEQAEVMQGLDRLSDQLHDLDHARATWQGQLHQQVLDMRLTTDGLRRETQTLSTALRRPQVRGRWGELHLRRAVEVAGPWKRRAPRSRERNGWASTRSWATVGCRTLPGTGAGMT